MTYAGRPATSATDAVRAARHLGAFIERRLETPWADPSLGLTPERLLELSARPPESGAADRLLVGEQP